MALGKHDNAVRIDQFAQRIYNKKVTINQFNVNSPKNMREVRKMSNESKKCSSCGSPMKDGEKFCPNCGKQAGMTCRHCGSEISSTEKFCHGCGKPTA